MGVSPVPDQGFRCTQASEKTEDRRRLPQGEQSDGESGVFCPESGRDRDVLCGERVPDARRRVQGLQPDRQHGTGQADASNLGAQRTVLAAVFDVRTYEWA